MLRVTVLFQWSPTKIISCISLSSDVFFFFLVKVFSPVDRSGLLDDAFNLARYKDGSTIVLITVQVKSI